MWSVLIMVSSMDKAFPRPFNFGLGHQLRYYTTENTTEINNIEPLMSNIPCAQFILMVICL